ncbi:MAG: hypothetical protein KDD35_10520, partial [Bdellovibrionales bacterium]|nr:hypothetical protein [Bdellovibrionales bacterium]
MFKSLFFPVFLASLLFSCGSGSSRPRGKQCGIDYIPIKVEKQASEDLEEISLDPQAQQLPQGTYDFENLDFYLVDAPTKMEFHIKGAKNKSGEFTTSTECVRGVHPEIPLPESTSIGLEKMSVDDKKG